MLRTHMHKLYAQIDIAAEIDSTLDQFEFSPDSPYRTSECPFENEYTLSFRNLMDPLRIFWGDHVVHIGAPGVSKCRDCWLIGTEDIRSRIRTFIQMWKESFDLLEEIKAEQSLRIRLFEALIRDNRVHENFVDQFRLMMSRRCKRRDRVGLHKDKKRAQEEVEVIVEVEHEIQEAMALQGRIGDVLEKFIHDVSPWTTLK